MIEVKTANKSFVFKREYVRSLFANAVRQGKDAVMVIDFPGYRCQVAISRTREK